MNKYKATIGIEVHTELNTASKMFSSSPASSYDEPNTNINEIDLGMPGTLPSPNKNAVIKALILACALQMQVDTNLCFDRKNYFYQDLPKGFQITQQYQPIGKNGHLAISNKTVRIERIHLEEDTAKQQIVDNNSCLDYNRCGVPLIEIVSQPDMETASEAIEYLNELRRILIFLNISDGKMEDGSFRADINISVAEVNAKQNGTKVEIKNINSFANIGRAIEYEFNRQVSLLSNNKVVVQETRRWDEEKNQTIFMRLKSDAVDYRYFREPNIIEIDITDLLTYVKNQTNVLPTTIKQELMDQKIPLDLINQLLDNYDAYKIFHKVNTAIANPSLVIAWVLIELGALLKTNNTTYNTLSNTFLNNFIALLKLLITQEINGKQAKSILENMFHTNKSPEQLIKELNFVQIKDPDIIKTYLEKYIKENPIMLNQYQQRPERVEKFFIGLLMRDTKGQANPNAAITILKKLLN